MDVDQALAMTNDVYRSWASSRVSFALEDSVNNIRGFRRPQRAAAFAIFSHLDSEPQRPATVIMPTGTGKTDTIFAVMIAGLFQRTLIVVPSDSLRSQIGDRLQTLQRLREIGAISTDVLAPIVHRVHGYDSAMDSESILKANVSIATPASLAQLGTAELELAMSGFSHLIVDEAHHVTAETWARIKSAFQGRPTIYFTATPFRQDQQRLGGKIIFNYSLKQAQEDKYFQQIEFYPIREYVGSEVDRALAIKATELLRVDLGAGFDHILIARCSTIKKATKVFAIYRELAEDLEPVVIHSESQHYEQDLKKVTDKKSRIVVCVDMFGEGFDLPQLKIAAIHNQHQSPAVTLQFIGRLTRADPKLGTAKFVANIANQRSDGAMRRLYEENADWSMIIREVSNDRIGKEIQQQQFEAKFEGDNDGARIVALNPKPNTSSLAYHVTKAQWTPDRASLLSGRDEELQLIAFSEDKTVVMAVTKATSSVDWAQSETLVNVVWHLYVAYYRESKSTLFVTCTSDEMQHSKFLKLLTTGYQRINGEVVFRIMSGIQRLTLQNVGLSRAGRDVRFTMHVGHDVNRVIAELEDGGSIKSNIFGTGFADGETTSAGCSAKGKLWKMDASTVDEWVRWCDSVSDKLNDSSIDSASVLKGVMRSEKIEGQWPDGIFFADWPDSMGVETESRSFVTVDSVSYSFLELRLGRPAVKAPTVLSIPLIAAHQDGSEHVLINIEVRLLADGCECATGSATIMTGSKQDDLHEYLNRERMKLLRTDGSIIFGNYRFYSPNTLNVSIPKSLLLSWDWEGTDISKESMSTSIDFGTVQGFTYQKIFGNYEIIFNDDGAGEIADLVAVNDLPDRIQVDLYHCKYCGAGQKPGGRVDDAYVVAGQASRSVKWLHKGPALFERMLRRFSQSQSKGFNRLLKGSLEQIDKLRHKSLVLPMRMEFFIVQPAFSVANSSPEVMTVLGTSYKYLRDIAGVDLRVICSP